MRSNLFNDLMTIQRNFDQMFNRAFGETAKLWSEMPNQKTSWVPAIDCFVKDNQVTVRAFLPGVDEKNVSLTLTDNVLVIQGERHRIIEDQNVRVLLNEVSHGTFERRIALPEDVLTDQEKCSARFENGVLEITMPVVAQYLQSRQIPIETAKETKQLAS